MFSYVLAELHQVEPGSARTTAESEDGVEKEDETFDEHRPSFLRISPKKATSEVQDLKSGTANACSFAPEARAYSDNLPAPRNSQPHSESSARSKLYLV
ncbi:unnamed protein product [Auanema sp. JU1783]|nr:unnamed protein product [Auanema sp. JU1783]